ncbi:MAG TPA: hypothetical protein VFE60_19110 [Roseiarcus sp.]|jgi:hypothetical protein|nr:hypothetical protein [Roseiarcus sp.]
MTRWTLAAALGGALFGFVGAPALAQNAAPAAAMPTKLRPKTSEPKTSEDASTVTVMVTNSRKADLVQLQAAESGSVNWKRVLGSLKSGNQVAAQLPRPFNCRVDLHGSFSDGQSMDASDVNVCEQKTLNLTD